MTKNQINRVFRKMVFATPTELYSALYNHIGHEIEIRLVSDTQTKKELGIEVRCLEPSCHLCEPLLDMDEPQK